MKKRKQFKLLMKEAENDVVLLQKEFLALQIEVGAGTGVESELKGLKQEWRMKEQLLRSLATRSSTVHSKKIKLLRVNLKAHITRHKKIAKVPPIIFSVTSKSVALQDVLKGVKFRRASLSRWLSNSPNFLIEKDLIAHKQAFKLLKDIDILVNKVKKISRIRQEINGLKKAISDAVKFIDCNQSLISHCCSILTSSLEALKPHVPESAEVNSLSIMNGSLKAQGDINIENGRGSYREHYDNQITNETAVIHALQNEIMLTDEDMTAILRDCETDFSNINVDEFFLPLEDAGYMKSDFNYDREPFVASADKETEDQATVDICNSEEANTQFSTAAGERLLSLSAYEYEPSTSCQITAESSACKLINTDTRSSDDLVMHLLFEEACDFTTDSWSWLDQFLERSKYDDGDIRN
jgi:hypothetical protein